MVLALIALIAALAVGVYQVHRYIKTKELLQSYLKPPCMCRCTYNCPDATNGENDV